MMGPPALKPEVKENDDQMDVLANAGVDLRAEESFAMSFHTGSFGSNPAFNGAGGTAPGHGFTQFIPQGAGSFYGAGPANQPGEPTDGKTQKEIAGRVAEAAWAQAAQKLAQARQHELSNPHTHVGALWMKMDKIAREHGLGLSTDNGKMPLLKLPNEFNAEAVLKTAKGPDGTMVVTKGTFLPQDTALADQLALMSLATNTRMRILLEEAVTIARGRRVGSHGVVPGEWADVAEARNGARGTVVPEDAPRAGWESATSPHTIPTVPATNGVNVNGEKADEKDPVNFTNDLIKALRASASAEREYEEKRLLRRQNRPADGVKSSAPGTPGMLAPEPSAKPLSKKEREKQEKDKRGMADNHAETNATTATFLFGSKKKNKYSWMTGGASSGPSTPGGALSRTSSAAQPEKVRLTAEGKNRMGGHREDKEGGAKVQMRDLVAVLEADGRENRVLQRVYAWLDNPKPKGTSV
jgi:hypothetical protein